MLNTKLATILLALIVNVLIVLFLLQNNKINYVENRIDSLESTETLLATELNQKININIDESVLKNDD